MTTPAKFSQIVVSSPLSTAAPLPVVENADGRISNANGTSGSFLIGGPFGRGQGSSLKDGAGALRVDQMLDANLRITGAGAIAVTTPTAAAIVSFLSEQGLPAAPTSTWPNGSTTATVYYPTFDWTVTTGAGSTPTITGGAGVEFVASGTWTNSANSGALVAQTTYNWRVVVSEATPGSAKIRVLQF